MNAPFLGITLHGFHMTAQEFGNLFDRVVYGHVIDFILVHWQNRWYFPAFNLADSAITLGAILLALDMFKPQKSGEPAHD